MGMSALDHYATQARIAELEAEVARLRVDAERYQWLRNSAGDSDVGVYKNGVRGRQWIDGAEMDHAIDDARVALASKGA